jgi:hypothetical protein
MQKCHALQQDLFLACAAFSSSTTVPHPLSLLLHAEGREK